MFALINLLVLVGIIITSWLAISIKDLVGSIIALCGVGVFMMLEYLLLKAPDVALTEAAVGLVVTPVIFLATLSKVRGGKQ